MNKKKAKPINLLLGYQTQRLQELIEEILRCCKERTLNLSTKFNISESELRCLRLFGGERYLTAKNISQKLNVTKSRVTKIISGLMQKKLVKSIDDPRDARIKLVMLTKKGQKKSEELSAIITDIHRRLVTEFEPQHRKMVLFCLEMLRSGMEIVKKQLI